MARELKNIRVSSTVGLGAILKYFGLPKEETIKVIKERFNEKIAEVNIDALNEGYKLGDQKYELSTRKDEHILINGNSAVALGAIAAGCRYYCAYPMTPSTGVLTYMSSKSNEMGIAIDQVEDEVAALNMALGAAYAGVRAMTGSSGGGIALMVESLSLAGIIETPVVIINVQRPGPATGLPTRTEQADLRFIIHAGFFSIITNSFAYDNMFYKDYNILVIFKECTRNTAIPTESGFNRFSSVFDIIYNVSCYKRNK